MIQAGDRIPSVPVKVVDAAGVQDAVRRGPGHGRVVLFAVPGAFTPTCDTAHLPGFIANAGKMRAMGVDRIVCAAANDHHVCKGLGRALRALRSISSPTAERNFARRWVFQGIRRSRQALHALRRDHRGRHRAADLRAGRRRGHRQRRAGHPAGARSRQSQSKRKGNDHETRNRSSVRLAGTAFWPSLCRPARWATCSRRRPGGGAARYANASASPAKCRPPRARRCRRSPPNARRSRSATAARGAVQICQQRQAEPARSELAGGDRQAVAQLRGFQARSPSRWASSAASCSAPPATSSPPTCRCASPSSVTAPRCSRKSTTSPSRSRPAPAGGFREGGRERRDPLSRRRDDHHLGRLRPARLSLLRARAAPLPTEFPPSGAARLIDSARGSRLRFSRLRERPDVRELPRKVERLFRFGRRPMESSGAEGATAPETLRQKDRSRTSLWKAHRKMPPKEQPAHRPRGNLSG